MVSLVIFSDSGQAFCMGKDPASVVDCVQACTNKRNKDIRYIKDYGTRIKYIERAIEAMGGEET